MMRRLARRFGLRRGEQRGSGFADHDEVGFDAALDVDSEAADHETDRDQRVATRQPAAVTVNSIHPSNHPITQPRHAEDGDDRSGRRERNEPACSVAGVAWT